MFLRLNVSEAAVKTAIRPMPLAIARSRPFMFGTRAEYRTPGMESRLSDQFVAVRQLRNPLWMDERSNFNVLQSGCGEQSDEFRLLLRRNDSGFVLETIARTDLNDAGLAG